MDGCVFAVSVRPCSKKTLIERPEKGLGEINICRVVFRADSRAPRAYRVINRVRVHRPFACSTISARLSSPFLLTKKPAMLAAALRQTSRASSSSLRTGLRASNSLKPLSAANVFRPGHAFARTLISAFSLCPCSGSNI